MELVKIDHKEYGLESKKAAEISDMFKPMLDKMVALEKDHNTIIKAFNNDIKAYGKVSEKTIKKAKDHRQKYVKVRTETARIHKELKHFYLQGGRFVDGWKNAQLMASEDHETALKNIEEYNKVKAMEEMAKIQKEREAKLEPYGSEFMPNDLALMTEETFSNYLEGVKLAHENRIKREKEEEKARIKAEKEEAERIEKMEKENARLKAEQEKREKEIEAEREKERKAREKIEKQQQKQREEYEKRLKKEREAKEKLEREAREREEAERAEKERKLKLKDAGVLTGIIRDLEDLKKDCLLIKSKVNQEWGINALQETIETFENIKNG